MFRVRKSMIQVGRLIVDFVNNELELTLETQGFTHNVSLRTELTNGFSGPIHTGILNNS